MRTEPQTLDQLPTPCLVVERSLFDANVAAMSAAWPGLSLRPHVKAFKSTAIARILADAGHESFCPSAGQRSRSGRESGMPEARWFHWPSYLWTDSWHILLCT